MRVVLKDGEALQDTPISASMMATPTAAAAAGVLFMTNLRLIWERAVDRKKAADGRLAIAGVVEVGGVEHSSVCVSLGAIDRLRKRKAMVDGNSVVEVVEKYNARPSLRVVLNEDAYAEITIDIVSRRG